MKAYPKKITLSLRSRSILEVSAGLFLCFGYLWFMHPLLVSWMHGLWYVTFIVLLFISKWLHGETWRDLGIRWDNFFLSAKILLPITLIGMIGLGIIWNLKYPVDLHFYQGPGFWQSLARYPLWALIQQYIVLAFFFRRFSDIFHSHHYMAVLFSAIVFSALHIPNSPLMIFCFLGGLFWAWVYNRHPNLLTISLSQAVFGVFLSKVLLAYVIVGPHADVGRWTKQRLTHYSIDYVNNVKVNPRNPPIVISKDEKSVIIKGWVVGVEEDIDEIFMRTGGHDYEVQYGLGRKDVAEYYNNPRYLNSGFRAEIPLTHFDPGLHVIHLKILLKNQIFYHYPRRKGLWIRVQ